MATTRALSRNVPYLKQQFSALLKNTSPVITFICLITICGYLLSFSETAVTVLSVTPGYILPPSFWIWTAFTFCFIELHLWEVIVDIVTVGLCGKLLEPLWGQMEMFQFFGIVNLGVAILTSFYYLFVYMCTKNSEILFNVHIHGLAGYVAGVSVAVRQMMPDHLIIKTRLGKFTNRNVPLTVLFAALVLWSIGLLDGTNPAMFCSGLIVSWIYLRFYQRHPNGRGDSSESFTFASFFPNVMQPVISMLVNPLYLGCLKLGVVKPPAPPRSSSTSSLTSVTISVPGVDPHDVERRRQIALKALSERLKSAELSGRHQNTLPKSFPLAGKQHQHHHHHHHGGGGIHHHHPHIGGSHQHSHHQHHHPHPHNQDQSPLQAQQQSVQNENATSNSSNNSKNIPTTDFLSTSHRFIPHSSVQIPIPAIPLPAPPPKIQPDPSSSSSFSGNSSTEVLLNLDTENIPSTSSSSLTTSSHHH